MTSSKIVKIHLTVLILILLIPIISFSVEKDICIDKGDTIWVNTNNHTLYICKNNRTVKDYRVAFGRGGVSKRKKGDKKTPLGRYTLGSSRPSEKFGVFIPINYPTKSRLKKALLEVI